MKTMLFKFFVLALMLLGLPLLGILLLNKPISPYMEFPPRTIYVQHAPFSPSVFTIYALFILTFIIPLVFHLLTIRSKKIHAHPPQRFPFPLWGWFGIYMGIIAWILAWSRISFLTVVQTHTFTPLWIGYIMTVNALTYKRTGHCMLLDRPRFFLFLFPTSALFWWFFEYLNRFVQNWYYVIDHFGSLEYFLYATLPFSTVLPAVMGTMEWLLSFNLLDSKFQNLLHFEFSHPKILSWSILFLSGTGLTFIGIYPNYLFPLLWISPLLIIVSLQSILNEPHVFSHIPLGDWRLVLSSALAALICGFFWEMWNYYSFAKWKYNIPFLQRFHVFEMPILGYGGYLPFGIECSVISTMLLNVIEKNHKTFPD